MSDEKMIYWLDEVGKDDISRVGGKGANLGELLRTGFSVPKAFIITASAYERQISGSSIADDLRTILENNSDIETSSRKAKKLFLETVILQEIENEIRKAYRALGKDVRVAVRSSATAEDLPEASFAGQQETFLGIYGEEALLESVRECWASLWNSQAINYREKHYFSHTAVALSIVVQEMVAADTAGVMFTVDPINEDSGKMVLTASYGLGEAVVSGQVNPDTYLVNRQPLEIIKKDVAQKERMVVQKEEPGSMALTVPPELQRSPALNDSIILVISRIGLEIENHYGAPQDIEWAVAGGNVYILQSRPITTLGNAEIPVELPGMDEKTYGWVYLGRVPMLLRTKLLPSMIDHFPNPLRPFDIATNLTAAISGFRRVAKDLGIQIPEKIMKQHTSGLVLFSIPAPSVPRTLLHLPKALVKLKHWSRYHPLKEWLEVDQPYLRNALSAIPTKGLPPKEILGSIQRIGDVISENHYRRFSKYMAPGFLASRRLTVILRKVDKYRAEELKQKLTQGLKYKTAEINQATKGLARSALRNQAVKEILSTHRFGEKYSALLTDERCQDFIKELNHFLEKYGSRTTTMEPQPSYPTWKDDPDYVLTLIDSMLQNPQNIVDDQREKEEEYQQVRAFIKSQLRNKWVNKFEQSLETMRNFIFAREATLFFFEKCVAEMRCLAQQLAQDLTVEGELRDAEDLYFLLPDELKALIEGERLDELKSLAIKRRMVWDKMATKWRNPTVEKSVNGDQLRGVGASRGVTTGTVKVIHGPEEFGKLHPGDVLVCSNTSPAWTPLFFVASGVIAEMGSVLSHAAIVARENGIPAVMACPHATQILKDGDQVEVNGVTGEVRKLHSISD